MVGLAQITAIAESGLHAEHKCNKRKPSPFQCLQSEIDDMIWEVDEDCDQAVNWQEFQAMYFRCNNDQAGAMDQDLHPSLAYTTRLSSWQCPAFKQTSTSESVKLTIYFKRSPPKVLIVATFWLTFGSMLGM